METRRIELDPRYRNRTLFVRERADAGPESSAYRTVLDIEKAKRTNYEPTTLRFIENLYRLAPGCIAAFLAGGEIVRLEEAEISTPDEEQVERFIIAVRRDVTGIPEEDREELLHTILEQHRSMIRAYRRITGVPEESDDNDTPET